LEIEPRQRPNFDGTLLMARLDVTYGHLYTSGNQPRGDEGYVCWAGCTCVGGGVNV